MNATIEPGKLRGSVAAPASKSHMHRLLIAAALAEDPKDDFEETLILRPGDGEDVEATVRCLNALNCAVFREEGGLRVISSTLWPLKAELDCGESGSTLRFLMPLCAAGVTDVTLTGRGRLPERPNGPLLSVLRAHGARIEGDFLPLSVRGGLRSGDFALPGNVSSQYFSGLLFVLPLLEGDSTLRCTSPLESMPYVNLTLSVLRQFRIIVHPMEDGWKIPGNQRYSTPVTAEAEGDWSAAAFWLGANALGSQVAVNGLNDASCQGDRAIREKLQQIGGEIDVTDTPDLMPILSAVAAATPGKTTRIAGAARLRLKESDRLSAMAETIQALGGDARETPDGLIIRGCSLRGGTVDGKNDHRIVMSAAVAATVCREHVTILGAGAVSKSYPRFWADFQALGGSAHV